MELHSSEDVNLTCISVHIWTPRRIMKPMYLCKKLTFQDPFSLFEQLSLLLLFFFICIASFRVFFSAMMPSFLLFPLLLVPSLFSPAIIYPFTTSLLLFPSLFWLSFVGFTVFNRSGEETQRWEKNKTKPRARSFRLENHWCRKWRRRRRR